jgi:hypothetical protein
MNPYDELSESLVGLSNAAAGVREKIMHLPQPASNSECQLNLNKENSVACIHDVDPQDILRFNTGKEDIEVERLLRIIANASEAAGKLKQYVDNSYTKNREHLDAPKRAVAQRYAATLRDSLGSLAELMGGEITSNRFYEERPSVFKKEKTINDVLEDAEKLTLAFVYQRLKTIKRNIQQEDINHPAAEQIQELMNEIKSGELENGQ